MLDRWTFEHAGKRYRAEVHHDSDTGAPWAEHDGHGPVSEWVTRDKRPGELVLSVDSRGRARRFYDFAGACKQARAECWDAPPYKTGTRKERATRAALADFERLRAWCNDEWCWVGVIVTPFCECCGGYAEARAESCWGIESDAGDLLREIAEDLAGQVAAPKAVA